MISVKKDFDNPPKVLLSDAPDAWKDPSVMDELNVLYHGKCAYCETKTDDLVIDHYRPKSKYPWLANEWSNLLPACKVCNAAKGDKFPVENNNLRANSYQKIVVLRKDPLNGNDKRANANYLTEEKPLLIHPEVDTPENYFSFSKDGLCNGMNERGRESAVLLDLNRRSLIAKRKELFDNFYLSLKKHFNNANHDFFLTLQNASLPSAEYSAFGSLLCYHFDTHLWSFLMNELTPMEESYDEDGNLNGYSEAEVDSEYENKKKYRDAYFKSVYGVEEFQLERPLSLKSFAVQNFQGIEKLEWENIPLNTQWVFLTGNNGAGKTSLLRAILLGLLNKEWHRDETGNARIEIDVAYDSRVVSGIDKYGINRSIFPSERISSNYVGYYAAYGANRVEFLDKEQISSTSSHLFNDDQRVVNFELELMKLAAIPELRDKKHELISLIKELIPTIAEITIEANKGKPAVFYHEKDDRGETLPPVFFDALALGMRTTIGLVGDFVLRLYNEYKRIEPDMMSLDCEIIHNFSDLYGIVLIDEFDNHLHPKWQKHLVEKLSELFPKVQFIVSTHSPIPLLGAPVGKTVIFNVNRTKEEGITVNRLKELESELPNLTPNLLLDSAVFDHADIFSSSKNNIYTEDTNLERKENTKTRESLKAPLDANKKAELLKLIKKTKGR